MPTKAKKQAQEDLRRIKAEAKAQKAQVKAVAAKKKAKAAKQSEVRERKAADLRGSKGVHVSMADVKDPALREELTRTAGVVPPHRHEVHLKKETITVIVTLHNVPANKIETDGTTPSQLVIATPKHTKKYRLEFPFPSGMRVDAEKGDYTLESGVLTCVFPVSKMPADVTRAWTDRLESVRKGQRARFDVSQEGDLVVRKRKTKLELEAAKDKKKAAAAKKEQKAAPAAGKAESAASSKKAAGSGGKGGASGKPAPGASDDKKAMLRIAAQAASKVSTSLSQRMTVARAAHERRVKQAEFSGAKKEVKATRMQQAFGRILNEKRRELESKQQRLSAASSAPPPKKKKDAGASPGKSVRFAK